MIDSCTLCPRKRNEEGVTVKDWKGRELWFCGYSCVILWANSGDFKNTLEQIKLRQRLENLE